MGTNDNLRRQLARLGVPPPRGRLQRVTDDVFTDRAAIVIKWRWPDVAANYLADLEEFVAAGVRCERPLHPEPVRVKGSDRHAVLLAYEHSTGRPTDHATDVGKLIRTIHDRVWPFRRSRNADEVYCPNDWFPQNVIVTAAGPVMVDLDYAQEGDRFTQVRCAVDQFGQGDVGVTTQLLNGYNHDQLYTDTQPWQALLARTITRYRAR